MMDQRVPVLLLIGSVGAGKTTVARAVARRLIAGGVPGALVDDPSSIAYSWPPPADDSWNQRLYQANLAAIWANFRAAGARRLVLCQVIVTSEQLEPIREAVPGAEVTVVRLHAPLELVRERLHVREAGEPGWYLEAADFLVDFYTGAGLEDHVVDNVGRRPDEVAVEVVEALGWLPSPADGLGPAGGMCHTAPVAHASNIID